MDLPADRMLAAAARVAGASDLVLDPCDDGSLRALVRVEGMHVPLAGMCAISAANAAATVARLKALAQLPAYITQEPQDGRIDGAPFGFPGDLRLATLPTVRGERIALRLPALGRLPDPDALGLDPSVLAGLRRALQRPDGLVLVTGPTGSGKTTTIHSLLTEMAAARRDRTIVAIEDPVERRLAGVVQVEVRPHAGFGFLDGLRAALRQDVDVIVVGEIRDPDTARAAVRAALTGHLVIATMHCGRAVEAAPRLIEMGVEQELLLPALSAVLAQRLVRLRHAACQGSGCTGCQSGFLGRAPVADLLQLDHAARTAIAANRVPTLTADLAVQAAALTLSGRSDAGEVRRVLG